VLRTRDSLRDGQYRHVPWRRPGLWRFWASQAPVYVVGRWLVGLM
jgi:hypothetical protein